MKEVRSYVCDDNVQSDIRKIEKLQKRARSKFLIQHTMDKKRQWSMLSYSQLHELQNYYYVMLQGSHNGRITPALGYCLLYHSAGAAPWVQWTGGSSVFSSSHPLLNEPPPHSVYINIMEHNIYFNIEECALVKYQQILIFYCLLQLRNI